MTYKVSATPFPLTALTSPAASRSYIVGSKRSGLVGKGECEIWRRRCAGSGARAKRTRGVTRMVRGLIHVVLS